MAPTLSTAAFLEFLPGSARAGVVAIHLDGGSALRQVDFDFLVFTGWGHRQGGGVAGLCDILAGDLAWVGVAGELLWQSAHEVLELVEVGGGAEQVTEGFALDVTHEGFEQGVGLVLVFHQWVFLSLGAEVNPFAQGVHVVEVFLPEFVKQRCRHSGPQKRC